MLFRSGEKVRVSAACTAEEMLGVNDIHQLQQVEEIINRRREQK